MLIIGTRIASGFAFAMTARQSIINMTLPMTAQQSINFVLRSLLFSLIFCLLLSCSDNSGERGDSAENAVPVLLATLPVNGAVVSPDATERAVFVFDCPIVLVDRIQVKINGAAAPAVYASADSLYVRLNRLDGNANYTVTVGANAIKAQPAGKLNPEAFTLGFTTADYPPQDITPALAVADPSPEAVKLYDYLKASYGKTILSGTVANVSWNISEAQWVYAHTGKYPALNAFDYIFLFASPSDWIDYSATGVVEDWWNSGGIVSCMWHWNVPNSAGSADRSFYTGQTDFDIREALREGTPENTIIMSDLQKVADYLLLLKAKNIPVLWRPLHEAKGNLGVYPGGTAWFWWGAGGAEPFKQLWRLMFDFFESRGLNNLIWVLTSEPDDGDWYPGDEYVDIIGRDMYHKTDPAGMLTEFNTLQNRYRNKIITLSECGDVAGIPAQWNVGATWSWFMSWYDYERTNNPADSDFGSDEHEHFPASLWRDAFNDGRVISRDEVPNLK
jgi:mannan endo-1,4-beta-mannosidase